MGGGTAVAQLAPIVLMPLVSRIYSDSDLGILGLYTTFVGFVAGVLSLGYSEAIVSATDDEEALQLLTVAAILIVPSSLLSGMLMWILSWQAWLGFDRLPTYAVPLVIVSLSSTGSYFALRYWLIRREAYDVVTRAVISQGIGRSAFQVLAGFVYPAALSLMLSELVGRTLGLRPMWSKVGPLWLEHWGNTDRHSLWHVARRYKKFPLFSVPATVLDNLGPALNVPLITGMFGIAAAGQYSIANAVVSVPVALVGASVGDVFHGRLAIMARSSAEGARRLFVSATMGLFVIGLVPALILVCFGERLFELALGPSWSLAGSIAAVMAPRIVTWLVVNPLSRVVFVYEGQYLKLVYNGCTVSLVLVVYGLSRALGWPIVRTLEVLTWSQVGIQIVYYCVLFHVLRRGTCS